MNLIISFSGRANGNCDEVSRYIATNEDVVICFRELNVHDCSGCEYECMNGYCKYHHDAVYDLYDSMLQYDKVFLIVPMYCSNPSSLYFKFHERSQDYFMHNEHSYDTIVAKLYIIGIYGSRDNTPDFIPCLEQWFDCTCYDNHVLRVERHQYGQKLDDRVLGIEEIRDMISSFVKK